MFLEHKSLMAYLPTMFFSVTRIAPKPSFAIRDLICGVTVVPSKPMIKHAAACCVIFVCPDAVLAPAQARSSIMTMFTRVKMLLAACHGSNK